MPATLSRALRRLRSLALRALREGTVSDASADALHAALVDGALEVPPTGAGRLDAASVAVLCALASLRAAPRTADPALALRAATEPSPLLATLYTELLVRHGGEAPEGFVPASALRARVDALVGPAPQVQGLKLTAAAAEALLGALAFASSDAGGGLLFASIPTLAAVATPPGGLNRDTSDALCDTLRRVVDGSTSTLLSFNRWPDEAKRAVGDVTHRRAVASLTPAVLAGFAGRTWTTRQAAELLRGVEVVRDHAALARLEEAVRVAADLFPGPALAGTAWAAVRRALQPQLDAAEGAVDRRSDLVGLLPRLRADAAWMFEQIPALSDALAAGRTPELPDAPSAPVTAETAAWLARAARDRLASERSLPNLLLALRAGPEAAVCAQVEAYMAQWPTTDVFDFNKLDRVVQAALSGDTAPIYTLRGAPVEPARFHLEVGLAVKAALAAVPFPLPWIAHRFGYRAKQAAELVDLLAERAGQGKGPVAQLRLLRPGAPIHVLATTSDLEYNSLIFQVETGKGRETWYADSAGQVQLHARAPEPKHVLFDALVDARGGVAVDLPAALPLSPRAYPLISTWGLGDRIDVETRVDGVVDRQVETERFQTAYQVFRGTIVAFDTDGNHTVEVETPTGKVTRAATWDQVRSWNNPHLVAEVGGAACSVRFDRGRDARFAASLAEADRIAAAHGLPEFDLSMNEVDLAAAQKRFLRALNAWSRTMLIYPRHPPFDDADKAYDARLDDGVHPMGDYLEIKRGVCRHQFIHEHMGKQRAGIDERFASGAANTYQGAFRGLHIWGEVILADRSRMGAEHVEPTDTRYLSDATWGDPYVPLWDGAYGNDLRRVEMYARTAQYATLMVKSDLR